MPPRHRNAEIALRIFLLAMLGLALRAVCSAGELWLDEIWSLTLLRPLSTPFQILTLYSDNNHPLNSLWLWYAGSGGESFALRGLSLLASAIFLWDLSRAWRDGILPTVTAIFLIVAYPLVLYGSEARGYMPMLLGLWICWRTVAKAMIAQGRLSLRDGCCITAGAVIGACSHGTFLYWYPALCLWAVAGGGKFRFENLVLLLPGLGMCAGAYLFFFRLISAGTGTIKPTIQILLDSLSVIGGGPELTEFSTGADMWAVITAFSVACIVLIEIVNLLREGKREWIFFLFAIILLPALSLYIQSPRVLFIRYFLPSVFSAYLLLGSFCQRLSNRDMGGKVVCLILSLGFVAGNLYQDIRLARLGRCDARGVIWFLLFSQPEGEIVISGDHIFRDRTALDYFKAEHPEGSRIQYRDDRSAPWRLISSQDQFFVPLPSLEDGRYSLVQSYPSAQLSGWSWYLYRLRNKP